jgi:hypothetical protein
MNPPAMATVADSSEQPNPTPPPPLPPRSDDPVGKHSKTTILGETTPWIEYAVQQAQLAHEAVESTIEASKSRLSQIMSTSSTHFHQTIVNSLHCHLLIFSLFVCRENSGKDTEPFNFRDFSLHIHFLHLAMEVNEVYGNRIRQ